MSNISPILTQHTLYLSQRRLMQKLWGGFRTISLSHSVAKLFSKLLSNRLAPELNNIVSRAQSAFIKKRSIQDNFLYSQNIIRSLYRNKTDGLFLKLDIAKAFDSVRWDFVMEVLHQFGFGRKWQGWVTTSSSAVLLNGSRGRWFKHCIGLRQGTHSHQCYSFFFL